MLTIPDAIFHQLLDAANRVAPLEACGLLGGVEGQVTRFHALTNADASAEHYRMRPEEQFAALKEMRANGDRMLAIWHSHPASPARMSAEDLRLAYTPGVAYAILSLAEPGGPRLRAFEVQDGTPIEIPVVIEQKEKQTS